jgi:hypothetical protein
VLRTAVTTNGAGGSVRRSRLLTRRPALRLLRPPSCTTFEGSGRTVTPTGTDSADADVTVTNTRARTGKHVIRVLA